MNIVDKVAVSSRSFSKNRILRAELQSKYANVTFNDSGLQFEGDQLVNFLQGHHLAITALEKIDDSILSKLPLLKAIGKYGVGLDMIDMGAMRRHSVRLGWTGGVNKRSVAELVIAQAIAMLRNIPQSNEEVRSGTWKQNIGRLLSGKTVGIIGCGNVGKDLITLLKPFNCNILAHDILDFPDFYRDNDVFPITLDRLLSQSDIVSLHLPLDASTKNLINKERLSLLLPNAILINFARGGIVDEKALKTLLREGRIGGACFDVFETEPPEDSDLLNLPNFIATPHIGGSSEEAVLAMGRSAIKGLEINEIP
jgi:phosphoglycerate dehydrogenase-like enzyme